MLQVQEPENQLSQDTLRQLSENVRVKMNEGFSNKLLSNSRSLISNLQTMGLSILYWYCHWKTSFLRQMQISTSLSDSMKIILMPSLLTLMQKERSDLVFFRIWEKRSLMVPHLSFACSTMPQSSSIINSKKRVIFILPTNNQNFDSDYALWFHSGRPIILGCQKSTVNIGQDGSRIGRASIRFIVLPTPKNFLNQGCLAFQFKKKQCPLPFYEPLLAFQSLRQRQGTRSIFIIYSNQSMLLQLHADLPFHPLDICIGVHHNSLLATFIVVAEHGLRFCCKSFQSFFDCFRVIVGSPTGFCPFQQSLPHFILGHLEVEQKFYVELISDDLIPCLQVILVSREAQLDHHVPSIMYVKPLPFCTMWFLRSCTRGLLGTIFPYFISLMTSLFSGVSLLDAFLRTSPVERCTKFAQ